MSSAAASTYRRNLLTVAILMCATVISFAVSDPLSLRATDHDSLSSMLQSYDLILRQAKGMTLRQIKERSVSAEKRFNINEAAMWYRAAFSRDISNLPDSDLKILASLYSNCGSSWLYNHNNTDEAYRYLSKAIELSERFKGFATAGSYVAMGRLFANYGDYRRALEYLRRGLRANLSVPDRSKAGEIYAHTVFVVWEADSLQWLVPMMRAYEKASSADDPLRQYNFELNRAYRQFMRRDYGAAAVSLENAVGLIRHDYNPDAYAAATYLIAANIRQMTGNNAECKRLLDKATPLVNVQRNFDLYTKLYKYTEDYYRSIGDEKKAHNCRFRLLAIRDSLYSNAKYGSVRQLEFDKAANDFDARLKVSEEKQAFLQAERDRQRAVIVIGSISAAVIISLLIWIIYKNQRLRETNRELFKRNIEILGQEENGSENIPCDAETLIMEKADESEAMQRDEESFSEEKEEDSDVREVETERERLRVVFDDLRRIMASSPKIFDPDFSAQSLAALSGYRPRLISKAVNTVGGKNFAAFLGHYRVREACRIMLDKSAGRPTIEVVAERVGYRSRPYFSKVFKAVTGMTTTEFLRQAGNAGH